MTPVLVFSLAFSHLVQELGQQVTYSNVSLTALGVKYYTRVSELSLAAGRRA